MIFLLIISAILLACLIFSMCRNIKLCQGKSEHEKQRISFVHGNVNLSNPNITKELVAKDIKCPVENLSHS